MRVGEHKEDLVARLRLLARLVLVALAIEGGFFWVVQVVRGSYYETLAENNRLRKLPLNAPRGLIYDRDGRLLVENVPSYNLLLDRSRMRNADASLRFAATLLERPPEELRSELERYRSTPSFAPVLLAENLTLGEVARFSAQSLEHPEFEIEVGHLRLYRHGLQTAHVLGYLGEPSLSDLQAGRGPGDLVGKKGVEQRYDQELRGHHGERVVVVDSRGRLLEQLRGESAQAGQNLELTLDLDLQQAASEALADQVGTVVALDPRNGEILALVSSPAFNPNQFVRHLGVEQWRDLLQAPNNPLLDRALQNTYSPGSVFKAVIAVAALSEHVVEPSDTVFCGGVTTFYNRPFRCWKKEGHGRVDLLAALKGSCDIYFYTVGQKLGIERIAKYARLFGFDRTTGIDLAGEKSGIVPDPRWSLLNRRTPWYAGETISVAIGQGPLLVTPLQVAEMMAVIANGGYRVTPHIVKDAPVPGPQPLPIDHDALTRVRQGLWAVVNDGGTGQAAQIAGLDIAGKTSTVQVIAQHTWTDSSTLPFEQRDHAWFGSFAPAFDPRLVVVVFVEHGGKGSAAAAPIAKRIYETYFRNVLAPRQPS